MSQRCPLLDTTSKFPPSLECTIAPAANYPKWVQWRSGANDYWRFARMRSPAGICYAAADDHLEGKEAPLALVGVRPLGAEESSSQNVKSAVRSSRAACAFKTPSRPRVAKEHSWKEPISPRVTLCTCRSGVKRKAMWRLEAVTRKTQNGDDCVQRHEWTVLHRSQSRQMLSCILSTWMSVSNYG